MIMLRCMSDTSQQRLYFSTFLSLIKDLQEHYFRCLFVREVYILFVDNKTILSVQMLTINTSTILYDVFPWFPQMFSKLPECYLNYAGPDRVLENSVHFSRIYVYAEIPLAFVSN
jgi:hypothetical protein